jgi:hypothetical protein
MIHPDVAEIGVLLGESALALRAVENGPKTLSRSARRRA